MAVGEAPVSLSFAGVEVFQVGQHTVLIAMETSQ